MKFRSKIILFAAVPLGLFVVALVSSIGSLIGTRSDFHTYIQSEQAIERGLSEMYAQGLQMGQALRNVVLDDKNNATARANFKSAQEGFAKVMAQTQDAVKGSRYEAAFTQLPALREAQAQAQEKVLALAAANGDAIAALNSEETPTWRKLRGELLQQKQVAVDGAQEAYQQVSQKTDRAITISLGLDGGPDRNWSELHDALDDAQGARWGPSRRSRGVGFSCTRRPRIKHHQCRQP